MKAPGYENGFKLTLHPDRLTQPMQRKKPTTYFVNSMSDLFHEGIPDNFLDKEPLAKLINCWVFIYDFTNHKAERNIIKQ